MGRLLAPRLAVNADAELQLTRRQIERGGALGRCGDGAESHPETPRGLVHLPGDGLHPFQRGALVGRGPGDLLDEQGGARAPAPRREEAVGHGHVVIDQYPGDPETLVLGELRGHLEVQHVARVVLDDEQHPRPAVDRGGGPHHLVRHGRGEHLSGAGRGEHPGPDEPRVQRLVPGAAAGDQRHLPGHGRVTPYDDPVLDVHGQLGVGGGHTAQCVRDNGFGDVDQHPHGYLLVS